MNPSMEFGLVGLTLIIPFKVLDRVIPALVSRMNGGKAMHPQTG